MMGRKFAAAGASNIILLIALMLNATPAYAYLDPGTGSVILQATIGALAAGAVVTKLYWHRILRFLGKPPKAAGQPAQSMPDKDRQDRRD